MISLLWVLCFISSQDASSDSLDYGDVYLVESAERTSPRYFFSVNYAGDLSNSFLELDGLTAQAQFKIWKYLSTGAFGHYLWPRLSNAGRQLNALEDIDIHADFSRPEFGYFSLTELQLMIGKWNLFNSFPLQVDLLFGGGAGVLHKRETYHGPREATFSYLWAVEQRFQFFEQAGLNVALFGHTGGTFLQAGVHASFY